MAPGEAATAMVTAMEVVLSKAVDLAVVVATPKEDLGLMEVIIF